MSIGTVILVPGFAGTSLVQPPGFGYPFPWKLWLLLERFPGYYPRLRWGSAWKVGPGAPLEDYYGYALQKLRAAGWDVVQYPAEWRGPVMADAARLTAAVANAFVATQRPVHLFGHSRGGLVMRAALGLLNGAGLLGRVGRCVALGTPHRGTLAATTLLGATNDTLLALYTWLRVTQGWHSASAEWADLTGVINSWPGLYELSPDPGHPWPENDGRTNVDVYDRDRYGAVPVRADYLSAARETAWPGLPELPAGVPWLDVVGTGVGTPARLTGDPLDQPSGYTWYPDGDGTVWTRSLVGWPAPGLVLDGVGHTRLPQDGRALDAAVAFLNSP